MNTNLVGLIGELQARNTIDIYKSKLDIRFINNFYIEIKSTYYQVDCLIVCSKGIFCVEVKNWRGYIYCGDTAYWRTTYDSGDKTVPSPLIQNKTHCRHLRNLCNMPVENIVLFTEDGILYNPPSNVMYISDFINYIEGKPDILPAERVNDLFNYFNAYKRTIESKALIDFVFKRYKSNSGGKHDLSNM